MKKYLKNSFYYLLIGFLPLASNFLLTPLFTRYLAPEEYGILALAALFQSYLTIIISSGLDSAFNRYFFVYFRKPLLLNSFFTTILVCVAGISALYSLFFYFFGDRLLQLVFDTNGFTYSAYGNIVMVTTITSLLHALGLSYYRNHENLKGFATLAISFFVCMTLGSVIGVIFLQLGAWGNLAGKMAGALLVVLVFLFYFFSRHPIVFRFKFLKAAITYGLPVIPYVAIGITLDNLDRFFIERYLSLTELGKYNIAFLIASVTAIFLQSVSSAINPSVYKLLEASERSVAEDNNSEINALFKGTHLFILTLIAGAVIVGEPLVRLLIGKEYHSMVVYLPLLFLAYVPRVYYVIYATPLFYHHKTKLLPAINLFALLIGGALMFLLLNWWGILGVCFGVIFIKSFQTMGAVQLIKQNGFFVREMFSMRQNHLLSFVLSTGVSVAVLAGIKFPSWRMYFNSGAGLTFFLLAAIIYGKQYQMLKQKFLFRIGKIL